MNFLTALNPVTIGKIFNVIGVAMNVVERVRSASGKDKEQAVIAAVQDGVPGIEQALGIDFVNDASLNGLLSSYIAARVALLNGIAAAKALKPVPPVSQ